MKRRTPTLRGEGSRALRAPRRASETERTTSHKDRRASESGDTLIEILIAVLVLGMASVALIIAFGTSISASADHRQLSASGVALDSISQQVIADMQATPSLFGCPYDFANYEAATFGSGAGTPNYINVPANFAATFDTTNTYPIEYWDTTTGAFSTGNPATSSTCVADQPQLVTVSVTDTQTNVTYNNSFVVDSPLDTVSGSGTSAAYGTASQLVFTTNPGASTTGNALPSPFPAVTVEDSSGNPVLDDLSPVLLSLVQPGGTPVTNGATLSGCSGLESQGVVTFTGCSVNVQGSYELEATDGDFTGSFYSQPFTVTQAADYLTYATQPSVGLSGSLMTQPVITVRKSTDNSTDTGWTGTVTLTASGGSLTGCSSITFTASMGGVGAFSGCRFAGSYYVNPASGATLATPYTLTATPSSASTTTSPVTSSAFAVAGPGSATQLVFSTQPTGSASAVLPAAFATEPVVTIEDSFGNIVTSSGSAVPVTLSISGGSLQNCASNPLTTSGGSADFSRCGGSATGNGLKLTATSSGLTSATSAVFNITGVASQLIFTTQPVAGTSGTAFKTQPVITVEDAGGNTVTAATAGVTLASVTSGNLASGILQFCTGLVPYEGVISVQTCTFSGVVGNPYYLVASEGSLSATSGVFSPTTAGVPTQLDFTTEPVAGPAGSNFATQPVVDVEDAGGNVVTTSTTAISLTSSGGYLSGCSNLSAVTGVVNVAGCAFGGLDTSSYQLTASAAGLASSLSTYFAPSGPGAVSLTLSNVTANPAIVQDNGTAFSNVTVTLEDAYSNVIPGKTIELFQGATNSVISVNPIVTGSSGTAVFTVTDTNREVVTYSASDESDTVVLSQQPQVSFATQLPNPTNVVLSYGPQAGSIGVTFSAPAGAPAGQSYTALACTNSAMNVGCVGPESVTSGGLITGLAYATGSAGSPYYVTITATASTGYLASTSSDVGPQNAESQVMAPTNVVATPSTTTVGAISVTFTLSSGVAPVNYTVLTCTSPTLSSGCTSTTGSTSPVQVTGLTPGAGGYYAGITANPPVGFVSSNSSIAGPTTATQQLATPSVTSVTYGSSAGSLLVSFAGSTNAPTGQTYTVSACPTSAMTNPGCQIATSTTSPITVSGLAYTVGSQTSTYFVTVTANADVSSGYLAAISTPPAGPFADTSMVQAPVITSVAPSTTTPGVLVVNFTDGTTGISSYTAAACTSSGSGCGSAQTIVSGGQITGLIPGNQYYVTVTAVPLTGYAANATSTSTSTMATAQLAAPTISSVAASTTTGGALVVNFTGPATGVSSYTAAACTSSGSGCGSAQTIVSGGQITGLTPGTNYYVQLVANGATGYLSSTANTTTSFTASTVVAAPTITSLAYGTTAGSIQVNFTGSTTGVSSFTAKACTDSLMSQNCVSAPSVTTGGQITGLNYTQGSAGTTYYVTVTANAAANYVSATSATSSQADTSVVSAPTNVIVSPSTTTANAVVVTFTNSTTSGVTSYTAQLCTSLGSGCSGTSQAATAGGTTFTGLTSGVNYYAQVTTNALTGYLAAAGNGGPSTSTVQIGAMTAPTLGSGTTGGSLTVTFTAPSPAAISQAYTALACTSSTMASGCAPSQSIVSGGQYTGLIAGTAYYVQVTATASTGYLQSVSAVSLAHTATYQTSPPAIVSVTSGTSTTSGSLTVNYTNSSTTGVTSYTVEACIDSSMTQNCVSAPNFTSGGQITGLTAGSLYYIEVTANPPANYAPGSVTSTSPTVATEQLLSTGVSVTSGISTSSGSLTVNLTAPTNAPSGQKYNVAACTGSGTGCLTAVTNFSSGGQLTGLTPGTTYYVQVIAVASTGYFASTTNATGATATEQLTGLALGTVSGGGGSGTTLSVPFTPATNAPSGQSYSVEACTGPGMTGTCFTVTTSSSPAQFSGLGKNVTYYVQITAVASTGYLAEVSSISPGTKS